jgi:YD repeat-containing protein
MAVQPITGREPFWGDVQPSESQVSLINDSPTLQTDLHDYADALAQKQVRPLAIGPNGGSYFDNFNQHRIVLPHDVNTLDDNTWIAGLSHELGHFESRNADSDFRTRYSVNPRDPEAYDLHALMGMHGEGEAMYNNWKIEQEIFNSTSTPGHAGTKTGLAGEWPDGPIEQAFSRTHASDLQTGLSDTQDKNRLIETGAGLNALQVPSTAPSSTYYNYYGGENDNVVPTGLGSPTAVTFGDLRGDGGITSMDEYYGSGLHATQNFDAGGKLTSANIVDAAGSLQKQIGYARQPDGSYTATRYDGQGVATELDEFRSNGTSVAHRFNADRTQTAQAYDARGNPAGVAVAGNEAASPLPALRLSGDGAQPSGGADSNEGVTEADATSGDEALLDTGEERADA